MATLRISGLHGQPLLDIGSYARRGPGRRDRLTPSELALIGRTVRRTPEVMVKVLSKDSNNLRSVARHVNYIGRYGELSLETDTGEQFQGRGAGQALLAEWDLDLDAYRWDAELSPAQGRAPKLVHKVMLSMPPGTPPRGVLAAARNFAREEFGLKHRYALVLHTDEPHPHAHLIVKAVSEQGERLNISKATLRAWRREFARHLRDQGIAANATERAVRGQTRTRKLDGIYRASQRGDSSHMRARATIVAAEVLKGSLRTQTGKARLLETRKEVERGWQTLSEILVNEGRESLASQVRHFAAQLSPPTPTRSDSPRPCSPANEVRGRTRRARARGLRQESAMSLY
jgi:Relaxase/Mobilisation nuclease domain